MQRADTKKSTAGNRQMGILGALGLMILAGGLYSCLFPPISFRLLGAVALVPWALAVVASPARIAYLLSYITGAAFFFVNIAWIAPITIPGYICMCLYLGLYWFIAAMVLRKLVKWPSLPMYLALPIAWVGCEWLRGIVITGFPWFFLGHSQAGILPVIQIADLVGVYGISFVLAMVSGWIAQVILTFRSGNRTRYLGAARRSKLPPGASRRLWPGAAVCAVTLLFTIGYGYWRLGQDTIYSGPPVAVVQENFPLRVENTAGPDPWEVIDAHLKLAIKAAEAGPALVAWPETSVPVSINPELLDQPVNTQLRDAKYLTSEQRYGQAVRTMLKQYAAKARTTLVVGVLSKQMNQPDDYPQVDRYNSALVFGPAGNYLGRYDKIHLVLFGEFVPFRYSIPWLYRFLNENMTPYGRDGFEYSLTAGRDFTGFDLTHGGRKYRFATPICYEDALAYVARRFARTQDGRKGVDFLINISNDGWFGHSTELSQHLEICTFRAVENRVGIIRAVNTGVSAFIDPVGRIKQVVKTNGKIRGPEVRGFLVGDLKLDKRISFYTRGGDWFAVSCAFVVLAVIVWTIFSALVRRFASGDN